MKVDYHLQDWRDKAKNLRVVLTCFKILYIGVSVLHLTNSKEFNNLKAH